MTPIPEPEVPVLDKKPAPEFIPAKVAQPVAQPEKETLEIARPLMSAPDPVVIPAKPTAVEIPKLKDPDMKLQAITWSRTPEKRIAVINNRILREGEVVSGYLIRTINQDDVIMSLDGIKWKLLFR